MSRSFGLLTATAFLAVAAIRASADDKPAPKDNSPPKGFIALFNGKDLTGWQGLVPINKRDRLSAEELHKAQAEANERFLPHWTVENGVIHYDGKGNNLQTAKDYGNFELYVDWKIKEKGDSGLYLRGNPQVQIWDSDNLAENLKKDWHTGSGGLWNNRNHPNQPLKKADKPVGQWNTFHILMKGDKVTVWLNDEKVVDETPLENYWDRNKPLPEKGPIELQHHGDELWFKNIYIRARLIEQPTPANSSSRPISTGEKTTRQTLSSPTINRRYERFNEPGEVAAALLPYLKSGQNTAQRGPEGVTAGGKRHDSG